MPPRLILVSREHLRAGRVADYDRNEREIAAASRSLNCPNPYLALTPTADPTVVWWLNEFASREHMARVEREYKIEPFWSELQRLTSRKEAFRTSVDMTLFRCRTPEGDRWPIATARFMVVVDGDAGDLAAPLFESEDVLRLAMLPVSDRGSADTAAERAGHAATILEIKPAWSFPAAPWVAADPDFWNGTPEPPRK